MGNHNFTCFPDLSQFQGQTLATLPREGYIVVLFPKGTCSHVCPGTEAQKKQIQIPPCQRKTGSHWWGFFLPLLFIVAARDTREAVLFLQRHWGHRRHLSWCLWCHSETWTFHIAMYCHVWIHREPHICPPPLRQWHRCPHPCNWVSLLQWIPGSVQSISQLAVCVRLCML